MKKSIFITSLRKLTRWYSGQRPSARQLNEPVDALNEMLGKIKAPSQVRPQRGGGGSGFSWALLRKVVVEEGYELLIEVQRIRYTKQAADQNVDYEEGTPWKIEAYGDVVEAYPAPGSTYPMFNVPLAIRKVSEIPPTGEIMGWTIFPVKLYGDRTIEWGLKLPENPGNVDPDDEVVSA